MNTLLAPVSPGELLDKITILRIKAARIGDAAKLANVRHVCAPYTICLAPVRARTGGLLPPAPANVHRRGENIVGGTAKPRLSSRSTNLGRTPAGLNWPCTAPF